MAKRPTLVLFGYALYLVICGLSPLFVVGIDSESHFHGIRLAAVIGLCGLFASRVKRSPTLAVLAIDSAALLIICTSINYARLANKWYGVSGVDWYTPYLVGAMAIGGFLAVWLLIRARPKQPANCGEWWRPTPLITVPTLLILPFTRRRHGLGFSRRIGLALGALLLAVGFGISMSSRLPQVSIAQLVKLGKFAQENDELLRIALAEPDLVAQLLKDPSNARDILDDPRAKELLEELSAEGGMLHGVDTQAMVESIASGDFENINEILKDSGISGAEELLAMATEEDSALSELLGEEGAAAAKKISAKLADGNATLEEVLSEENGEATRKLISSVTGSNSDDSERPDMDELMRKLSTSIDPEMLKRLQGAGGIDINDSRVQAALKKMNIDLRDAAQLAAQASSSKGAVTKLISESGSNSLNTEPTTSIVIANSLGTRISTGRTNSKIAAELDESEISIKQPRLTFRPVAGKPKSKPFEPIYVQDIFKPQQDFITKRINKYKQSSATEIDAIEESIEIASKDIVDKSQEAGIQGSVDAIESLDAIPSASKRLIDIDKNFKPTMVANTDVTDKSQQAIVQEDGAKQTASAAAIDKIAQQLTIPLDDPKSLTGFLCMIVGLIAVSASLSKR